jgi:hypothetical protein
MLPLATLSQVKKSINTRRDTADFEEKLRFTILAASRWLTNFTDRRFDWRYQTLWHNARSTARGGDVSGARLILADDLQEITELKNGDGADIASSAYLLEPQRHANAKTMVMLINTELSWTSGIDRPVEMSINVTGFWGYGGRFARKGLTLTSAVDEDTASLTLTGSTSGLEADMMLRVEDELMRIESVAGATVTVERGFNESLPAVHDSAKTVLVFIVDEQVGWCVMELVGWMRELENAGGFGKVVVGDMEQVIQIDALPKNLRDAILLLRRKPRIRAGG